MNVFVCFLYILFFSIPTGILRSIVTNVDLLWSRVREREVVSIFFLLFARFVSCASSVRIDNHGDQWRDNRRCDERANMVCWESFGHRYSEVWTSNDNHIISQFGNVIIGTYYILYIYDQSIFGAIVVFGYLAVWV